jgi:hypothetical protein
MTSETQASFQLDSIKLLSDGFQHCRHADPEGLTREIPRRLQFLSATLAAVQQRGTFVVPIGPADLSQIPEWILLEDSPTRPQRPPSTKFMERWPRTAGATKSLSPTQRSALDFVQILVADLVHLAESGNIQAVRGLGYQFHNLPPALRDDSAYDRSADAGSLRVAATHWDQLSSEMRDAFSIYVGVDRAAIDGLVRAKGFADRMDY